MLWGGCGEAEHMQVQIGLHDCRSAPILEECETADTWACVISNSIPCSIHTDVYRLHIHNAWLSAVAHWQIMAEWNAAWRACVSYEASYAVYGCIMCLLPAGILQLSGVLMLA